MEKWYSNSVRQLILFLFLLLFCVIGLSQIEFGESDNSGRFSFTVKIQHFGMDSEEIERSITIPFENLLTDIPGIYQIRSTSEQNNSTSVIVLQENAKQRDIFFALRDSIDTLYASLPDSVQRPIIFSSSGNDNPVIIISFPIGNRSLQIVRNSVERELKPNIENIVESGEVEIGGGSKVEIHVKILETRLQGHDLTVSDVTSQLQQQYGRLPLGGIQNAGKEFNFYFDARIQTIEELQDIKIGSSNNSLIALGQIAEIDYNYKEPESINRVSGQEHVVLYVKASGLGSPVVLSTSVREALKSFTYAEFDILYDYGEEIRQAILRLGASLSISLFVVGIFLLLFFKSVRMAISVALILLLSMAVTLAGFSIIGREISIGLLTGMGLSIGLIADSTIIISLASKKSVRGVSHVLPALVASSGTTIVALLPLSFIPESTMLMSEMSVSFITLLVISLALSILFLPPIAAKGFSKPKLPKKIFYLSYILPANVQIWSFVTLSLVSIALFFLLPWETSSSGETDTIFGQLEYPSGTDLEVVDDKLIFISEVLLSEKGIERVETFSRQSNGSFSVKFDSSETSRKNVMRSINELNSVLYDGFIFIRNTDEQSNRYTIDFVGPDDQITQSLARDSAMELLRYKWVDQTVLHFKEGSPEYRFNINRQSLSKHDIDAATIANELRWFIYGPVNIKWQDEQGEMDLRVIGNTTQNLSGLQTFKISNNNGQTIRLNSIGNFTISTGRGRIYRIGGQRASSISFTSSETDLQLLENNTKAALISMNFPPGYSYRIDRSIAELKQKYSTLFLVLIGALVAIFIILASQYESVSSPIAVFITIPPTMGVILLYYLLSGQGLSPAVILGLIVASGLIVNNSILLIDEVLRREDQDVSINQKLRMSIRKRLEDLIYTSGSTLIGLLPLITIPNPNGPIQELSVILFLGISGSMFSTMVMMPAILIRFPVLIRKIPDLKHYTIQDRAEDLTDV